MGDQAAWGLQTRKAFDGARFRLLLSGTPFRSDNSAIPWVAYDEDGVSRADYVYGYPQALRRPGLPPDHLPALRRRDGVDLATAGCAAPTSTSSCRRRSRPGACARRSTPDGDWMGEVLRDGDARLSEVRADGHPDAGGLVHRLRPGPRAGDRGAARRRSPASSPSW